MSFDVQIKCTAESPIERVEYHEFKDRIQRQELGPRVLVCDRVLTNGEWWPLDELNVFHNNCPVSHPLGKRLHLLHEERLRREEQLKESHAQMAEYLRGRTLERELEIKALAEWVGQAGLNGVTRLFVMHSFLPERCFTFIFGSEVIRIEAVVAGTSIWHSIPQYGSQDGKWEKTVGRPCDPSQNLRMTAVLRVEDAPAPLRQWDSFLQASKRATDCIGRSPEGYYFTDGSGYRHELITSTETVSAKWINPKLHCNPEQVQLLQAYYDSLTIVKLEKWWEARAS